MKWQDKKLVDGNKYVFYAGKKYLYAYQGKSGCLLIDNDGMRITLKIKDVKTAKEVVALIEK